MSIYVRSFVSVVVLAALSFAAYTTYSPQVEKNSTARPATNILESADNSTTQEALEASGVSNSGQLADLAESYNLPGRGVVEVDEPGLDADAQAVSPVYNEPAHVLNERNRLIEQFDQVNTPQNNGDNYYAESNIEPLEREKEFLGAVSDRLMDAETENSSAQRDYDHQNNDSEPSGQTYAERDTIIQQFEQGQRTDSYAAQSSAVSSPEREEQFLNAASELLEQTQ